MATYDLREAVNRSAAEVPPEIDEFDLAGVTKAPQFESSPAAWPSRPSSSSVATTRPCVSREETGRGSRHHHRPCGASSYRGRIYPPDGRIDIVKIRPLARLGYYDYTTVDSTFEMLIPGSNDRLMGGLEGDARRTR